MILHLIIIFKQSKLNLLTEMKASNKILKWISPALLAGLVLVSCEKDDDGDNIPSTPEFPFDVPRARQSCDATRARRDARPGHPLAAHDCS